MTDHTPGKVGLGVACGSSIPKHEALIALAQSKRTANAGTCCNCRQAPAPMAGTRFTSMPLRIALQGGRD